MKRLTSIPVLGVLALAAVLAISVLLLLPVSASNAGPGLSIEAVKARVSAGKSRLEVRVVEAGKPVTGKITVKSSRLDMGPDGMEMMVVPLRQVPSPVPGGVAFEADLSMAGRWALTLRLSVEGRGEPLTGKVVFTAEEKRSDAGHQPGSPRKIAYYRNPMGLADISSVPRKDSMGMDYIPVFEDELASPGSVRISPEKAARAGVRTEAVGERQLAGTIRAPGAVVFDERTLGTVTVKFSGFIEELLVPVTGARVRAGQPLVRVWIESPEVLLKVADLIALRKNPSFAEELGQAEQNLRVLGIPDSVIAEIKRTGTSTRSIVLPAPAGGTVIEKPAVVGMRFAPGDVLYRTADLSRVWVIADVAERDLALVRRGQVARIRLNAYQDRPVTGKVDLIYPELNMATRTARVRIEVPNEDGRLKAGLYAEVDISTGGDDRRVVVVPTSAIIDDGERRIVFVAKDEGLFEARPVETGRRDGEYVEVRQGLSSGEAVVVKGNFLIDAESNLQAALANLTTRR